MRRSLVAASAVTALVAAHQVRAAAVATRAEWPRLVSAPYAPSPAAAPFLTLGYRELGADLMWIRTIGYFGGRTDTSDGVRALVEATLALDDRFRLAYDYGPQAIQAADHGVDNASHQAAIQILLRAMERFPDRWSYPYLIGQIYVVDLVAADPAQRRAWNEAGIPFLEKAVRMPGAPMGAATLAAHLQDSLGRHEVAVKNLREMILLTGDPKAQKTLIERLAKLEQKDAHAIALAMLEERRAFVSRHERARPALPATMFVLLGPRRDPYLPPSALAVDRDLLGTYTPEVLEPLEE